MGIYIYSIRSKSLPMRFPGKETSQPVHLFRYLTKPWFDWAREDSTTRRLTSRCDSYWASRGGTPRYIVLPSDDYTRTAKVLNGDCVYEWRDPQRGWDYDTPRFSNATLIGWAIKEGRTWKVVVDKFSFTSWEKKGEHLYHKGGGTFQTREEADAWIAAQRDMGLFVRGGRSWFEDGKQIHSSEEYEAISFSTAGVP